ncbi:MAG: hypothetical protein RBU23_06730 [Candidatus Auribacterota bacterium]|jgi:hypothetical protein|nr:hypothetical protein [Candidatus Auribacterota bacterium]
MNNLSENELKQFFEQLNAYETELRLKAKQDEFLDLYHQWLSTQSDDLRQKVNDLAEELQRLDSSFHFKKL